MREAWKIHNVFVFLLTFCLVGGQKKREMVARVIIVLGFQHKRLGNVLKYQPLSNFFYFDKSWNGKMIHLKCENFLPFANMKKMTLEGTNSIETNYLRTCNLNLPYPNCKKFSRSNGKNFSHLQKKSFSISTFLIIEEMASACWVFLLALLMRRSPVHFPYQDI